MRWKENEFCSVTFLMCVMTATSWRLAQWRQSWATIRIAPKLHRTLPSNQGTGILSCSFSRNVFLKRIENIYRNCGWRTTWFPIPEGFLSNHAERYSAFLARLWWKGSQSQRSPFSCSDASFKPSGWQQTPDSLIWVLMIIMAGWYTAIR